MKNKTTMKNKTVWDFIEQYYSNYYSSNEIAHNDDLCKLVNKEQEPGSVAEKLLKEKYNDDINNPNILIDYNKSLIDIYEKAIKNFLYYYPKL